MPGPRSKGGQRGPAAAAEVLPVHRFAFVQMLMRQGAMSISDAMHAFQRLTGSSNSQLFQQMVADQNTAMRGLGLKLRMIRYPADGVTWLGFINTDDDAPAKTATRYTHPQREFFKAALEVIACEGYCSHSAVSGSGAPCIDSLTLMNLPLGPLRGPTQATQASSSSSQATKPVKLSKSDRETTLRRLVADKWLMDAPGRPGHYCIGVRSFLELTEQLLSLDLPEATRATWEQCL